MENFKEYLDPDNEYALILADDDTKSDQWIEVPKGSEIAISYPIDGVLIFYKDNFEWMFVAGRDDGFCDSNWGGQNDGRLEHLLRTGHVVWKRNESISDVPDVGVVDNVNHPSHYCGHPSGIECIEMIKAGMSEEMFEGYLKGCCNKYLWRYKMKGGSESLRKAQWYLDRLIKLNEEIESRN